MVFTMVFEGLVALITMLLGFCLNFPAFIMVFVSFLSVELNNIAPIFQPEFRLISFLLNAVCNRTDEQFFVCGTIQIFPFQISVLFHNFPKLSLISLMVYRH